MCVEYCSTKVELHPPGQVVNALIGSQFLCIFSTLFRGNHLPKLDSRLFCVLRADIHTGTDELKLGERSMQFVKGRYVYMTIVPII
jgi:hypothetical protein